MDAVVHILPVLLMLWLRSSWKRARRPFVLALASFAFHAGWAAVAAGDYALDSVYLDGAVADRAAWRALWALAFASHFA